jgi:hypothetical protein
MTDTGTITLGLVGVAAINGAFGVWVARIAGKARDEAAKAAALGQVNGGKIDDVKSQSDGHQTELTKLISTAITGLDAKTSSKVVRKKK